MPEKPVKVASSFPCCPVNRKCLRKKRKKSTKNICCAVPQDLILTPLPFLFYVNDLHSSSALDPIMFADDTDLFYKYKNLKSLFSLVNQELQKIMNGWRQIKPPLTLEKQSAPFCINQVKKMICLSYYLSC